MSSEEFSPTERLRKDLARLGTEIDLRGGPRAETDLDFDSDSDLTLQDVRPYRIRIKHRFSCMKCSVAVDVPLWCPALSPNNGVFAIGDEIHSSCVRQAYAKCPQCGKGHYFELRVSDAGVLQSIDPDASLQTQTTVAEIEAAHMVDGKPFGAIHNRWKEFIALMEPGDELWLYCSTDEQWSLGFGEEGVRLMRDGDDVEMFVYRYN